jgi:hypothetical protein
MHITHILNTHEAMTVRAVPWRAAAAVVLARKRYDHEAHIQLSYMVRGLFIVSRNFDNQGSFYFSTD